MQCHEVARELSAPTGALAPDDLAGHLASCPECASWAARIERLDRLWEATRPPSPAESWENVWTRVSQPRSKAPNRWPARRVLIGFAIAQAAAVLIAALVLLRQGPNQPTDVVHQPKTTPAPANHPLFGFEANAGEILTLHIEGRHQVSVDRRPEEGVSANDTVAWVHDLYNGIEVIASASP